MIVVAVVCAALAAVVIGVTTAVVLRRERRLVERLEAVTLRLEQPGPVEASPGVVGAAVALGEAVARLQERAAAAAENADAVDAIRQRLELALDAVPEGVVVTDEAGRAVYRNAVAATYRDARHADALVAAALDELVTEAVRGESGEQTLELFGPPRRTLVVSATPLASSSGLAGALAVIEDVTERRRLDEVRRDFVANISHELKTPVGALSLLAETLLAEDDPDLVHRLAERMLGEAERVADTIEDLLALTNIETQPGNERSSVRLADVVDEAIGRIAPAAEQCRVELEVVYDGGGPVVRGDRRQLTSALYNLLDNAVKYSDEGSTVAVRTRTVDGTAEVSVEDQGIGIPARDLERVFERFYRVDVARHRTTGGTGLGLAIVRHVVQNHAGEVRVSSRLGEGSTFTLCLPVDAGRGRDASAAPVGRPADPDVERMDRSADVHDVATTAVDTTREARPDGEQEHLGAAGGGRGLLRGGVDRRVAS